MALAQAGKVRIPAATGARRPAQAPDVPTCTEPGIEMGGWKDGQFLTIAPAAGTPDSVVGQLGAATTRALSDPAVEADPVDHKAMQVAASGHARR